MINPFVIKKWAALFLAGIVTVISFYAGLMFYGLLIAIGTMMAGLLLSLLLANNLLKTPFRSMLEGKGILFLDISSTGIIRPFMLRVNAPYVEGKLDGKFKQDVFDREMVYSMAPPQEAGNIQQGKGKDGNIRTLISISEEEYNKGRFGMYHYPCVIWNSQLNTVLTKDWLSELEKTSFAEHQVLYLNRKVEELSNHLLNFGRYVIESTRPKLSFFKSKWGIIIIVAGVLILLAMLIPRILPLLSGMMGGAGEAAKEAASTVGAVIPK